LTSCALAAAAWPTMTPGLAGSAIAILSAVSRSLPPMNKGVVTDFDDMASYLLRVPSVVSLGLGRLPRRANVVSHSPGPASAGIGATATTRAARAVGLAAAAGLS